MPDIAQIQELALIDFDSEALTPAEITEFLLRNSQLYISRMWLAASSFLSAFGPQEAFPPT